MNTKKSLIAALVIFLGLGMSSFKGDDRNFQIAKNLEQPIVQELSFEFDFLFPPTM